MQKIVKQSILSFIFLFAVVFGYAQQPAGQSLDDATRAQQFNEHIGILLNGYKYDEAIALVNKELKFKEDPAFYFYLCHVYSVKHVWDSAIMYGNKALKLNPNMMDIYPKLFYAYLQNGNIKEAEAILDKVKQADPKGTLNDQYISLETSVSNQGVSRIFTFLLFLSLLAAFFIPAFNASKKEKALTNAPNNLRFTETVLIAGAISCVLWSVFYGLSAKIWSTNPKHAAYEFCFMTRAYIYEHDGSETFALYFMMFANMFLTLVLTPIIVKIKNNNSVYMAVSTVLLAACGYYLYSIGFYPPIPSIDGTNIVLPIFLALLSVGLYLLYQKKSIAAKTIVVVLAAFAGLISIAPPSLTDLMYILAPALRLYHGAKVPDIYFQYDMFLSYLALAWMKLDFTLDLFPYLGQFTFFLFYIGIFFFSDRFFKSKGLSVIFIIALMLVRFYTIWSDNPSVFQVTPIRLDLWLLLILIAYKKGIHHWLLGICIGLLVLFHRNLGLIYLGAYAELLCVLFALDLVNLAVEKNLNGKTIGALFVKHLRTHGINIGLVLGSIGLCFVLFKELFSASALVYRQLGIGMMPIANISFYWYVPLMVSSLVGLLFHYRHKLGDKYISIAAFIILLLIGNSVYFFGRSHENNVLNISGILMLAAFIIFDILIYLSPKPAVDNTAKPKIDPKTKKSIETAPEKAQFITNHRLALLLPVLMVLALGFFYNGRIAEKSKIQYSNLLESKFSYPFEFFTMDSVTIKQITNNSKKVYFLDFYYDFYFYYYGNYEPQGYFNPSSAWVYKKDLINLVQSLLDKNYYVVMNTQYFSQNFEDYLPYLTYNKSVVKNNFMAISKEEVPAILPEQPTDAYHINLKEGLPSYSINHAGVTMKDEFTIEIVTKPENTQRPSATMLTNYSRHDGQKGFILQANGAFPDKFVFGYSAANGQMPNIGFDLERNKWHALTITLSKENLKVYDNGKLLGALPTAGATYINSEMPLMIGNQKNRENPYTGQIRAVRISNNVLTETEIQANAQKALAAMGVTN